jgi:CRISPR-associated endonuclease/helicase Cas3
LEATKNKDLNMEHIAHVRKLENGEWDCPQTLEAHLQGVAKLAAEFAEDFDSAEWARILGMAHDSGKDTEAWQLYIRGKTDYNEEASSENEHTPRKCEHSAPGAKLAEELFGKGIGRFISYCIAGHHTGLPDWTGAQSSLKFRLDNAESKGVSEALRKELVLFRPKSPPWKFENKGLDVSLWIRMLFSCLIDADRLDTERYMELEQCAKREGYSTIAELHKKFLSYMQEKTKATDSANQNVYVARQRVLADCVHAAELEPGFFSLTVPTGGGKTLSSMAFALAHAEKYRKKRIIYGIPYTSIIEQNAGVFREVFGDDEVLEHHSSLDPDESKERSRLAMENWDAPIIVTTTVQLYESLFSVKTSRCRKLHNIANSVIILDEAQLVPIDFLEPIIAALRLLVEHYKVTVVLCTATQPVFEKQDQFPNFPGLAKGTVREIIGDVNALYHALNRVKLELPQDRAPVDWQELADELSGYEQVLCVVSDRRSCRELHKCMPKGTYHLSALMCAEHRSRVIAQIKEALKNTETVRVISTQLVEAGVDIDFPVVYRAMAGLDSIAQAAGRCNREGKLNGEGQLGKVVVFHGPRKPPTGMLRKAAETAQGMFESGLDTISDYAIFTPYFTQVYWKANSLDKMNLMSLLKPDAAELGIQFREVSDLFKIIEDKNERTILVPYQEGKTYIDLLKNSRIPEKTLLRKLQRFSINIYREQFVTMLARGSLKEVAVGIFALNNTVEYNDTGLSVDELPNNPEDFIEQKEV